ncbi:MAG: slipin family protein [Rubrobacter sp.]|nr:slipin family protein [Rubrobacter sp.]
MGLIQMQAVGLGTIVVLFVAVLLVLFILASAVRIVNEYERGVIFRLGRVQGRAKGPGLFFLIPIVDRMVKVQLRTVSMAVPPQEVITRDNVPARVDAVIYFRVVDPNKSVIEVENYVLATSQISQTTLRSVLGQKDLDDLLTNREAINEELQVIIDGHTEPWGVKVSAVEVKDVQIPQQMQRSMAGQAEAERERRAKIIAAEGEYQASQRLSQAADRLASPTALQLRLFQTLAEISSEQSSTVILPVPIDFFRPYLDGDSTNGSSKSASKSAQVRRREEEEAERRYEEAVGEAHHGEQQAMRELEPEGTNPTAAPTPKEDVSAPEKRLLDAMVAGEEQQPLGEKPPRPGSS